MVVFFVVLLWFYFLLGVLAVSQGVEHASDRINSFASAVHSSFC